VLRNGDAICPEFIDGTYILKVSEKEEHIKNSLLLYVWREFGGKNWKIDLRWCDSGKFENEYNVENGMPDESRAKSQTIAIDDQKFWK
jgi:hypothetical protein